MIPVAIGAFSTALVYLFKSSGNIQSNRFFAMFLLALWSCMLWLITVHLGLSDYILALKVPPIWPTWLIGPAWFYYVKYAVFPSYTLRKTDLKHFILPVVQIVFHAQKFLMSLGGKSSGFTSIFEVSTHTIEEFVFVLSMFGYLFASYRYLRFKAKAIGNRKLNWNYWKIRQLRNVQRILIVLFTFNFLFVAYRYFVYQFSGNNLLEIKSYQATLSLSFALFLLYVLVRVAHRQHFWPIVPTDQMTQIQSVKEKFDVLMRKELCFLDPDLHEVRFARTLGVSPNEIAALISQTSLENWDHYIMTKRLQYMKSLIDKGMPIRKAILNVGFSDLRDGLNAIKKVGSK